MQIRSLPTSGLFLFQEQLPGSALQSSRALCSESVTVPPSFRGFQDWATLERWLSGVLWTFPIGSPDAFSLDWLEVLGEAPSWSGAFPVRPAVGV